MKCKALYAAWIPRYERTLLLSTDRLLLSSWVFLCHDNLTAKTNSDGLAVKVASVTCSYRSSQSDVLFYGPEFRGKTHSATCIERFTSHCLIV